jgi:metal-dependent amidase/aminoacylase/carboxypeptidase family protein
MRPDERVHGCILDAPKVTNVIPAGTRFQYSVLAPTMEGTRILGKRVKKCFEAASLATGCKVEVEEEEPYADLRINKPLCHSYARPGLVRARPSRRWWTRQCEKIQL